MDSTTKRRRAELRTELVRTRQAVAVMIRKGEKLLGGRPRPVATSARSYARLQAAEGNPTLQSVLDVALAHGFRLELVPVVPRGTQERIKN